MKRGRRLLLVGLAAFVGTTMASVGGQQAQLPTGGVYTAAQAQAGQAAYARQCAGCHSADLRGSGDAPAVAGPDFIAKWGSRAVNELFTYVVQTMPPTNPGSLGEAGTLEVTAYLLQINGALAGQQP
jgi:S-disulfanyl-L-cysteine oxidoreductase SoxD